MSKNIKFYTCVIFSIPEIYTFMVSFDLKIQIYDIQNHNLQIKIQPFKLRKMKNEKSSH